MLGDDPFQNLGRAGVVPDAVRVNHRHRSADADAQAVGLGPQDEGCSFAEGGQPMLEEFPRSEALRRVAALRLRGIGAKEDMAFPAADSRRACCCFQFGVHRRKRYRAEPPRSRETMLAPGWGSGDKQA